jgi:hypothetical protein
VQQSPHFNVSLVFFLVEDDSLSNTRVTRIVDDKTTKPASKGSCVLGLSEDSAALIKVGVAGCG